MHHDYDIEWDGNADNEYPDDYGEEDDGDYDSEDEFFNDGSEDEDFGLDDFNFGNRPGYKPDPLELSDMYNKVANYYDFIYDDSEVWDTYTPIEN